MSAGHCHSSGIHCLQCTAHDSWNLKSSLVSNLRYTFLIYWWDFLHFISWSARLTDNGWSHSIVVILWFLQVLKILSVRMMYSAWQWYTVVFWALLGCSLLPERGWDTAELTLKIGFICPFEFIDPIKLGEAIMVAQPSCLNIFRYSGRIPAILPKVIKLFSELNILSLYYPVNFHCSAFGSSSWDGK